MPTGETTLPMVLACVQQNGRYTCPAQPGQEIKYDCTCANAREFVQAITALTAISHVSSDFICSSGEERGVCSSEELGIAPHRVVCYKDQEMELVDCAPTLWTGKNVPMQQHNLQINSEYQCMVASAGASYEPDFTFGEIVPQSSWFTPKMDWARQQIIAELVSIESSLVNTQTCNCGTISPKVKSGS